MNPVYDVVRDLITDVEKTQQENIEAAAVACAKAIENGGILQAFGSGHSEAGAMEVAHRAG
ncbi:MAG: SIS domain-containing protein, partial [Erysipelotrichaceae bacterium]|nr:SIS domain-containing protein [Erysipelotrichaceae bacterium]